VGLVLLVGIYTFFASGYDPRLLFYCVFPLVIYWGYVHKLQEEIVLYLLCMKNKWPYNPGDDYQRITTFITLLPKVFELGHDQCLAEQLWGSITVNDASTSFWNGKFVYITGSGRNQSTHTENVFIFELRTKILINFSLVKTGIIKGFEGKIKTESQEFNNLYHIETINDDLSDQEEIIKVLSPSVITRLIDFAHKYKIKRIIFNYNEMIIVLNKTIWKTRYPNFFEKVEIDERDETIFYEALKNMVALPSEMIQFIT
jgi:hypothetical protein